LDLSAPAGTPILAAASGKVVKAGWHGGYGMMVEISHGQSLSTRYAHAQEIHVRSGDWVGQGQMIAEVGSTGHSTGPHLHFEIRLQGLALDPRMFVGQDARLSLR
jgi:murein DD-endopeptidase MepM/ murein hydrolase activator NlpD